MKKLNTVFTEKFSNIVETEDSYNFLFFDKINNTFNYIAIKSLFVFQIMLHSLSIAFVSSFILNAIVSAFYPEFKEICPVIYTLWQWHLEYGELIIRNSLKVLSSIFTGDFVISIRNFWNEFCMTNNSLIQWISSI